MKRLQLLMLAAAGCLAVTSCSSDDDGTTNGNVSSDLEGTYELSSLKVPGAQDYDNDGDTSTDLTTEGSCFSESWISFHSNGTYSERSAASIVGTAGLNLDCDSKTATGTYTISGNTVTTTRTSGQGSEANASFTFNSSAHTLTRNISSGSYAAWNAATSLWANLTGAVQITFTKASDNSNAGDDVNDDDEENNANAELIGNFDLTAFIVATAQNLDGDGDSSTNLMNETNCYSDSNITFNADGTYNETSSGSILSSTGLSLNCDTKTTIGHWTKNGNTVTTTHLSGNTTITTAYTFDATTHLLKRTDSQGQYPGFNAVTSLFATLTGSINYTFTKDSN